MRLIKRLLGLIILAAATFSILAYALPRSVTVQRAVTINTAAAAIFPHLNSLKATEAWSPWLYRDPKVNLTYQGPESGVGSKLTWASDHPQVGNGSNIITLSVPNQRVETELDFGGMGTATAWLTLDPSGAATQVKWGFTTDLGLNPIARWMGLMMDTWVGADYQDGLNRLKSLVEG